MLHSSVNHWRSRGESCANGTRLVREQASHLIKLVGICHGVPDRILVSMENRNTSKVRDRQDYSDKQKVQ